MTTITTSPHRPPLFAAIAASAALVVGGAVGAALDIAWEHDDRPGVTTQVGQTTPESPGGATTSQELSGSTSGRLHVRPVPGGATTSQELSGSTAGHIPAQGVPGGATTGQESTQ